MDQNEKLRDFLLNDVQLTESNLRQLIEEFSIDNKTSEFLSMLCDMITQIDGQWYATYKITVIIKYLCEQNPKEFKTLLNEKMSILKSLKNYQHIDNFERDQAANVRINVEQLLDFIEDENKFDAQTESPATLWSINNNLNSTFDRLLQSLNSIGNINSEKILQKLRSDIARLNKYLSGPVTFEKYTELDKNPKIDEIIYSKLVEKIVDIFDNNFPIIDEKIDPIIENLMVVQGSTFLMIHENLIVLTDALKRSKNPRVTNSLVIILEKLIKSDSLFSAITEICKPNERNSIERQEIDNKWNVTLQIIVSLPNRIANKLDGKIPNCFLPDNYAKIISVHVARSVAFLNSSLEKFAIEPDARMISLLIGKALINLGSQRFVTLIDIISSWSTENPDNIRNLIRKILFNIDRSAMEAIAVLFLKRNNSTVGIDGAFENLLENSHWKHVFTIKIPLMSYYESENLGKNLISYLSKSSKNERILPDLVKRLMDIWGDKSALNHTSLEQHVYITKLILMAIRETKETLTKSEKEAIRRLLFSGTSAHLESTQSEIRGIGMITGEIVINLLNDSPDEPKLTYDYDGMPERTREIVEKLRNLEIIEESKSSAETNLYIGQKFENMGERKIYELSIECGILSNESSKESNDISKITSQRKSEEKVLDSHEEITQHSSQDSDDNLDSDDDLVPYDMSNDTAISEKLRPTYLRDLRENLLNSQTNSDPNIFAETMRASEDLILSQLSNDDASFAIELLEILVTLREISYVENFELLKYKACVSIVIVFPKETAKYLCKEFHTKIGEYSIKDRLFILDILGESARRLSKIVVTARIEEKTANLGNRDKKNLKKITLAIDTSNGKKYETLYDDDFEVLQDSTMTRINWEEIVNNRIESNTRRFAHSTKLPLTTMNKFNDVAGAFFYPLLYGFRREGTCMYNTPKTFEDQENILLVSYLKTLSTIMMSAENCVIVPKMAKEIMDLAWSLRYHKQAKVRLCVIENIASTVITLPKEGLTGELMELIFEFRAWLSDASDNGIRGDPDTNCRNLGKNVVALIDSIFRSTVNEL